MAYGVVNADKMTTSDGVSSSGLYGFKNRLINSAMVIDQRNAGASISGNNNVYSLDRWKIETSQNSKFTVQQTPSATETGYATRVGAGFTNYLACTSSAATSVGAGDYYQVEQLIEGFNTADLAWGTTNAKTVTLSFWAYSSLTGTFGGYLGNSAFNRLYPFTYTISSANTWTQISVTITGDTSGTWIGATNGVGMYVGFILGIGSTYGGGTANAWNTTKWGATGITNVVSTSGATFYLTGVQLEKGSTATSFDYRPYSAELAMCQRYYWIIASGNDSAIGIAAFDNARRPYVTLYPPVTMRTTPTAEQTATAYRFNSNVDENITMTWDLTAARSSGLKLSLSGSATATSINTGGAAPSRIITSGGYLAFTAEL